MEIMDTTIDDFLGGQVHLKQPAKGLRATSDSVLVAAAVPAQSGETILDVGTGNGVIAACLNARVAGLTLTGLDIQEDLLALARENAHLNHFDLRTVLADVQEHLSPLHGQQFHHVVSNPPFYTEPVARANKQTALAYQERVPLRVWLDFCLRHIRAKGSLTLIHRAEALPEILTALDRRLGKLEIIPLASKSGQPAKRIIVRGWLDSRQPLTLYPPLILHTARNTRTSQAEALLRAGEALSI